MGDLPGIRWEERGWQTADFTDLNDGEGGQAPASGEERRAKRRRVRSSGGNCFYLQPTTTCREALHIITRAWNEAGLPCLPVATENGTGFQGMLTKHDILVRAYLNQFISSISASVALSFNRRLI